MGSSTRFLLSVVVVLCSIIMGRCFTPASCSRISSKQKQQPQQQRVSVPRTLPLGMATMGSWSASSPSSSWSSDRYGNNKKGRRRNNDITTSKRQERVSQLVRTELSQILHTGVIRGELTHYLEADLRQRISVVSVDISPDLKQARVSVSVRTDRGGGSDDPIVDKRRAYSWLVQNVKPIRHTLSQRMSHLKASGPNLKFVQVDVAAAVDVMYLIDKVSKGYKREHIGAYGGNDDSLPRGMLQGIDFDEEDFDDDEWDEDEDDDFF